MTDFETLLALADLCEQGDVDAICATLPEIEIALRFAAHTIATPAAAQGGAWQDDEDDDLGILLEHGKLWRGRTKALQAVAVKARDTIRNTWRRNEKQDEKYYQSCTGCGARWANTGATNLEWHKPDCLITELSAAITGTVPASPAAARPDPRDADRVAESDTGCCSRCGRTLAGADPRDGVVEAENERLRGALKEIQDTLPPSDHRTRLADNGTVMALKMASIAGAALRWRGGKPL